ncbi:putative S1B family peptidase [Candidatus Promineifilum breve]|uniref:S1B family peptidase n=1 Tax=Candidatus Promineifilum breve TaxID=1806508 RepID=A0A160T2W1_9CHLR|nr:trypsin-like peptidase domain-containing protein [Candidatus Promineifilum breve]CUS02830.2 putative S1B family peptidase [Candidatus Promineifilum breve]
MYRFHRSPLLVFFVLLALFALACQAVSLGQPQSTPVAPAAQQALVDQAVATVMAQLPETTGNGSGVAVVPVSTDMEATLIALYERVNPSVVHIFVLDDQGFTAGSGSGFVYDAGGHIVTNNHVVTGSGGLEVVFADGQRRAAEVVGSDVDSDLAVIRVESLPDGVQPLTLGDSNRVQVGQFAVAIGNPFDETGSLSLGIISGLGRSLTSDRIAEGGGRYSLPQVIQTDAAINPGNSGGPLLNLAGEVIGVNSAISTSTGTNSGVGFSIPVNAVHRVAPALIAEGVYHYPYIGVSMTSIDLAAQQELGLPQANGIYITDTTPGSPAEVAGLRASGRNDTLGTLPGGDFIIAVDGRPMSEPDDLIAFLVFDAVVGQTISLTVIRDGEQIEVPLTLGERP